MSFDRLSIQGIAGDVVAGRRSAVQVVQDTLDRVARYDQIQPQTWIERVSANSALAAAAAVDARVASGERPLLAGVPFAVKDNIDVAGLPTTAGCPAFAYVPDRSATVVDRLTAAGAVLIGKTNLDQFATGLVGVRSPYGAPGCVFNRAYISGGSSSGSAVAVAAGLVGFALGTDTAGSGRVPAAINQLVGLKPTRGRWSTRGLVPACRSLDCITVLSTTVSDAARVDEVLVAFDVEDPYSRRAGPGPVATVRPRIAVPRPDQLNWFGDAQSAKLFASARERVAALGDLVEVDVAPLLETAQLLYQGPWVAERTAAVEALLRSNPSAIDATVRGVIQGGLAYTAVDAFKGAYALQGHLRAAEALWTRADVLLLPTAPTAYRIAEVRAEPVVLNANLGVYTNFVNLLDMSAVALPAGVRENNTGFGVSLIGPAWADPMLLKLAAQYEGQAETVAPPLDLAERTPGVALAVVGAHLHGMPLHWQLTSRDARLVARTRTAPTYRLYAMTSATPLKPALIHVDEGGAAIEVEIYELDMEAFGSFVTEVPGPLAIGTVLLADGRQVKGFVAEPRAMNGADDITAFGGWRPHRIPRQGGLLRAKAIGVHHLEPNAATQLTPPVPTGLTGLWRREEISTPGGYRDATTRVLWLQTQRFYIDIRIPADRPVRCDARGFQAYSDDELLRLAAVQGFAGVLTSTGDTCFWRRDLDYQPPGPFPDEARVEIEGDRMVERGLHADYSEIWRREPASQHGFAAFHCSDSVDGMLVIGGDHFMSIEGRDGRLPPAADLATIVRRDLDNGRRDLAMARLRMEICYGRIAAGEHPWEVRLSTSPWREGASLFEAFTSFDPATGRLMAGAERRWSLADTDVAPDQLIALFQPT